MAAACGLACTAADFASSEEITPARLKTDIERLQLLHEKARKPGPSDWLARHDEPGQTFAEYLECGPKLPGGKRRILYILPVGDFRAAATNIVNLTADYMGRFFNLPVKITNAVPLSVVPTEARRTNPRSGQMQLLSGYILDKVLVPRLPGDAAAMIAFTTADLWPGEGWNFVFGEASLSRRVGVWSIYRNGDLAGSRAHFNLCLKRTIKTAIHETGHMFTMQHCTAYECCMAGSNSLEESDRQPLYLCPECMAKVCWATQTDPVARYTRMMEFCERPGFAPEREFFAESIRRLKK